jgi:hypothetical protein
MYMVGMRPGEVYSETRAKRGACPNPGTRFVDSQGREFIMVKVGASQNLTNGMAVCIQAGDFLTTVGTVPGAGVPNIGMVGIVQCSITASTSHLVWAQVYGLCQNAIFAASASALPGAAVKFAADGKLTAVGVTTASAYIAGINCVATNSVIDSPVGQIFLNYPKAIGG